MGGVDTYDMCMEGGETTDSSVKSYLMDKRRRWIGLGTRIQ